MEDEIFIYSVFSMIIVCIICHILMICLKDKPPKQINVIPKPVDVTPIQTGFNTIPEEWRNPPFK